MQLEKQHVSTLPIYGPMVTQSTKYDEYTFFFFINGYVCR